MTTAFHPLEIVEVRPETDDSVSILFAVPEELRAAFLFRPGQHLTLRAAIDGDDVRRNYSVCVAPSEGELRIAVKRIAGGLFSNWANETLRPGMRLDVMPPHGSFTWVFNPAARRYYVGIAGGSGITPVLSLLKTALEAEPESRFTLLYGNRNSNAIMFLETLAGLKDRFLERLQIYHFLSEEEEEIDLFNGLLDRAKLDEALPALVDVPATDAFFICGPGPMMDAAEAALSDLGVDPHKVLIERFTVGRPSQAAAAANAALAQQAAGLRFAAILDGRRRTVPFDAEAGNLLDSAREAGLPAPYACKAGVCATCRAKVVSGEVRMAANYGLTEAEVAAGYVLTCQTVPLSDNVVVDYDA